MRHVEDLGAVGRLVATHEHLLEAVQHLGGSGELTSAVREEERKHAKYDAICAETGTIFQPFARDDGRPWGLYRGGVLALHQAHARPGPAGRSSPRGQGQEGHLVRTTGARSPMPSAPPRMSSLGFGSAKTTPHNPLICRFDLSGSLVCLSTFTLASGRERASPVYSSVLLMIMWRRRRRRCGISQRCP
jgi:hypothetical protein